MRLFSNQFCEDNFFLYRIIFTERKMWLCFVTLMEYHLFYYVDLNILFWDLISSTWWTIIILFQYFAWLETKKLYMKNHNLTVFQNQELLKYITCHFVISLLNYLFHSIILIHFTLIHYTRNYFYRLRNYSKEYENIVS